MYELPEWVEQLISVFSGNAGAARGRARRMSRLKHGAAIASENTEAGVWEKAAQLLRNAWNTEAEVIVTDYDKLRTELEALLMRHTVPVRYYADEASAADLDVVQTQEQPIGHSEIRLLLERFPHRFPALLTEE
jgi:hypothetical protein